ncbi:type II secretion system protein [Candidatus Falkowbacteria bacterium]|nr:type II secretion system protein [Candidatus Falkowbacteria bacterium]
MNNKNLKRGQSLLEMVFAIGILLFVVAAVLGLATSNVLGQKESEFQIVANNLAREGIEVVRNIRDSNWLAGDNWDAGLVGAGDAAAVFDSANNVWQIDFNTLDYTLNVSPDGIYGDYSLGQPSVYSRRLDIISICQTSDGSEVVRDNDCLGGEIKIGVKITATVSWEERGRQRELNIEDLLYDWK